MKKITFFLMCFALSVVTANAQVLDTIYNATSLLPTAAGWNELKLDATINTSAAAVSQLNEDGVLKLRAVDSNNKCSQLGWYKTGLGLNLASGYTIEIKAKVNNSAGNGSFNIQGFDNEGKGFRLGIYNNYLKNQSNPLGASTKVATGTDNTDGFHTFRLAVAPSGLVTLYRDRVEVGTFPISAFYFDNIVVNGGFEDGADINDRTEFPDFLSNGLLYKTTKAREKRTGNYALIMDSNGKVERTGAEFSTATQEKARTREFAVKPNTKYDISITRFRSKLEPYAWRDMGAFYDFQQGTQNGVDDRNVNAIFTGANDDFWQIHNQTITTPENAKTIRFEFPSWTRDGNKTTAVTAFDNFIFREQTTISKGEVVVPAVHTPNPLPASFVNLIANGDFEDWNIDNAGNQILDGEGQPTTWALSDITKGDDNNPTKFDALWNGNVRIQRHDQSNDELSGEGNAKWAHSGTSSLRFSTLGNNANNFNFTKELEPNKTYRFNFWHKSPKWDDWGWLKVKLGTGGEEDVIWGHELKGRNNIWANADIVFTTTEDKKTLQFFTASDAHGNWWNLYLDDLVLYEVTSETDPDLFAGKTNMIANGGFEDVNMNNDGTPYVWALASENVSNDSNLPMKQNSVWNSFLRIQDKRKNIDTGYKWAHSGNNSLRFTFLDNRGEAKTTDGLTTDSLPLSFRQNVMFEKVLAPNKTYTFVFWMKAANYPDNGRLTVANGDIKLWSDVMNVRNISWSRQIVKFSTTEANHTLRLYSEFTGWFNFYLDDIALYEEETYEPFEANGESYLFFGKSQGVEDTDVEIEYVAINTRGAYAPDLGTDTENILVSNLKVSSFNGQLNIITNKPSYVRIFDVTGACVSEMNIQSAKSISLAKGVYIVKSSNEVVKVVNK